jgi:hypothetical protein
MARVPLITSPCPLRWKSMPSAGRDFCGQCKRTVHNLDGMNDDERQAFFASCSGDVCVAYSVRGPLAVAGALGLGAAIALGSPATASAQNSYPTEVTGPTCDPIQTIVVGGTKAGRQAKFVDEREVSVPPPPAIGEISATDWLPTPSTHEQKDKSSR